MARQSPGGILAQRALSPPRPPRALPSWETRVSPVEPWVYLPHFWGAAEELSHLFSTQSYLITALRTLDTLQVWRSSRHGPTTKSLKRLGSTGSTPLMGAGQPEASKMRLLFGERLRCRHAVGPSAADRPNPQDRRPRPETRDSEARAI
jgi:hypothetical protein